MAVSGSYGIDYSKKSVRYGPILMEMLTDNAEMEISAIVDRLDEDKEVMAEIAERMQGIIRSHIQAGPGPALKEDTRQKRRRAGYGGTPLIASGTLLRGIVARSRKHFASARREKGTSAGLERSLTFAFLHDLGLGRMEHRPFMHLDPSELEHVFQPYESFIDEVFAE